MAATRPVSTLDLTKPLKVSAAATDRSKSDVFSTIAEHAGLHRRDVAAVFHTLGSLIKADLSKNGAGVFKVPGMMRITVIRKPATKARMGINPFTKEPITIPAKPAKRALLLPVILDRCFPEDREYEEKEVNMRLALLHPDVAALRRYLVDGGLMTRDAGIYRRSRPMDGVEPPD